MNATYIENTPRACRLGLSIVGSITCSAKIINKINIYFKNSPASGERVPSQLSQGLLVNINPITAITLASFRFIILK